MAAQWQNSRRLRERVLVNGKLVLRTPTHLGVGDTDNPIDMPLLRDPLEGRALLTGSTMAGALRNYLHRQNPSLALKLFGSVQGDTSRESYLIIDDALGDFPKVEFRDGVAINPKTRTAANKKKFDYELLQAGTFFDIQLELLVPLDEGDQYIEGLVICLTALEREQLNLGKRKRRGFGRCGVSDWSVQRFDMTSPQGMFAWLEHSSGTLTNGDSIAKRLLDREIDLISADVCQLIFDVEIDGSVLIRSDADSDSGPDFVHLHSYRDGEKRPIISGTSIAGALRQRTLKIANTLEKNGQEVANALFGAYAYDNESDLALTASRIWIEEAEILEPVQRVQSRIKIDRLTGSTFQEALFTEQPIFAKAQTGFRIRLRLMEPQNSDVGLLLLLVKDLWLGDLTLGGESSIGRGRLVGKRAELTFNGQKWIIAETGAGTLEIKNPSDPDSVQLQNFVNEFAAGGSHE